ncbi:MAG: IS630 family transposase [Candidatus Parvarchaeota archaeon]
MREARSLVFLDECHYQRGTSIRTWCHPEGRDSTVLEETNRKGISVFGAVNIDDGKLLTGFTDKYNAMTFLEFLCIVRSRFPNGVIVLDNALYHHASIVTDCAFLTGMDLLFMPPYSPELNSIERVWKLAKMHATYNKYFQRLNDLESALEGEFGKYSKRNREPKSLCAIT